MGGKSIVITERNDQTFPLTQLQEQFLFLQQLDLDSPQFNLCIPIRLTGRLDSAALERALQAVAARHMLLRSVLAWHPNGDPCMRVLHDPAFLRLEVRRLGNDVNWQDAVLQEALRPLDPEGPFWRSALLHDGDSHLLVITIHHIISDGLSNDLIVRDVRSAYDALTRGAQPAWDELSTNFFAITAAWQDYFEREQRFWADRLKGITASDQIRSSSDDGESDAACSLDFELGSADASALQRHAERQRCTLFTILSSAAARAIADLLTYDEVTLSLPLGKRFDYEAEQVVGPFADVIPLRITRVGRKICELVPYVRDTILDCMDHAHISFEDIARCAHIGRGNQRAALFNYAVTVRSDVQPAFGGGLEWKLEMLSWPVSRFGLAFSFRHTVTGTLRLRLFYRRDRYSASDAQSLCDRTECDLRSIIHADEDSRR